MTLQSLFPEVEAATQKPKPVRFKVIRPVYETLVVRDEVNCYFANGMRYTDPQQVYDAFKWLNKETKEIFISLHLDVRNRIQCIEIVSVGSLNSAIITPREVFKSILLSNTAAFLILHNHPSLLVDPSKEDIEITRRLRECGELLGIKLLDSIIIGESYYSFVSSGLM